MITVITVIVRYRLPDMTVLVWRWVGVGFPVRGSLGVAPPSISTVARAKWAF